MALKQEIKDFMNDIGVEVIGFAGPGRFDGPPSLDPEYVLKGAKSIISFAIPLDVEAIYRYLSKETAIPHNIDQIRSYQRANIISDKLVTFLKQKGLKAGMMPGNQHYRRNPNPMVTHPQFSHRYGAYVAGIAAPGISGNAITKKYGASVILGTVMTDAVLESDPVLGPRYFFDDLCQSCMACKAACPVKMFEYDKEEYVLINGELWPRGLKRDIDLCNVSCGGMHGLSADKKWSSWGKTWRKNWIGKDPSPETTNIFRDFVKSSMTVVDAVSRLEPFFRASRQSFPEGMFEDPNVLPDYEDLPGETEGQKIKAYAEALEKALGFAVADPHSMTCAQCNLVCGPNAKENLNRWATLRDSGILVYAENNEPLILHDYEEAAKQYKKYQFKVKPAAILANYWLGYKILSKIFGIDWHTVRHMGAYKKKLAAAEAKAGVKEKAKAKADAKAKIKAEAKIKAKAKSKTKNSATAAMF